MWKGKKIGVSRANVSLVSGGAVARVIFLCVAASPGPAVADDPCAGSGAEVKRFVGDLNTAVAGNRKAGTFRVEQLSGAERFRTKFVVDGKPVYVGELAQRGEVSDTLTMRVAKGTPAVLEISYTSGGGGAVSCNYRVSRTNDRFTAAKTK